MQSVFVALFAIAGLASAGPAVEKRAECPGTGAYYVCGNNNFRGYCSVDPCAIPWCPDFKLKTCEPATAEKPAGESPTTTVIAEVPAPTATVKNPGAFPPGDVCPPGLGRLQVCANNGFRGCCKAEACGVAWCPDYKPGTYEPVKTMKVKARQSDPTVCAPGTGFFQSCSNGFRGCCKTDACAGKAPVCPPAKVKARQADPTVCAPGTGFFQSCSNGFRGCCKQDACAGKAPVCPQPKIKARQSDPTVCAPGTGFFQSCSNGFRGCCKTDACAGKTPVCPQSVNVKARQSDPTVCAPGTGFFQSCSNGFRGCCKKDACAGKAPICPQ
ncbi:hypothetical protein MRS44_001860 [Fusarium solani]|uniref:uncharacterized protein n=1 Tax=Fusarium solani TaxID=169388 RepID=UPI0032C4B1B6|nr:hypothetical protein MRS44_001860 [Fusarium solani]